jgi:hypothetical protein
MAQVDCRNEFLSKLLTLQQDGEYAISAPTNWIDHEPLLEIPTDIDSIIDDLSNTMLTNNKKNEVARWHFFVGSPGNGKSAAMGKLCKKLISNKECKVFDENNIELEKLEKKKIPYSMFVREGNNKYSSAQIVQDASVVPNPFSPNVNPAAELLTTLSEAWDKGISLVICTNRGVLEKAHRDNLGRHEINSTPWFKILKAIVEAEQSISGVLPTSPSFDAKKTIFKKVCIAYTHLDNHSLLQGRDTFDQLIQKSIADSGWDHCIHCLSNTLCPFYQNRESLVEEKIRKNVINLLTKAEVLSGQVIVFREALAIISLVLSGCPRDYDRVHPCGWVQSKIEQQDFFSLATRRIYMSLFTPYSPYGLDAVEELRKKQIEAIRQIDAKLQNCLPETKAAINHIINSPPPCTDVGVPRLLGEKGTIFELDPCNDALPLKFYQDWDSLINYSYEEKKSLLSPIEVRCISIWKDLEENLETIVDFSVSDANWAIKRWSSNFLLHLGALYEGRTAWADELDEFVTLLKLISKPQPARTIDDKKRIAILDDRLETLLKSSRADHPINNTVNLSDTVTLGGKWVQEHLKPKTTSSSGTGSISLAIKFPEGEQAIFAAPMFLWLSRRKHLEARCFPQELLTGIEDARIRAASKGKYAIQNDGIELSIEINNKEKIKVKRIDGDVDVSP